MSNQPKTGTPAPNRPTISNRELHSDPFEDAGLGANYRVQSSVPKCQLALASSSSSLSPAAGCSCSRVSLDVQLGRRTSEPLSRRRKISPAAQLPQKRQPEIYHGKAFISCYDVTEEGQRPPTYWRNGLHCFLRPNIAQYMAHLPRWAIPVLAAAM